MRWTDVLWYAGAYLLGAVPTSLVVARLFGGLDLRAVGSGNLGATNLFRAMGWKAAVPVGLFDLLKGTAPVLLAHGAGGPTWFPLAVGLAAVVGHVFSPFVGFRGGKGVATAAGVFLALAPWALLIALAIWLVVVRLTGYVSLGSMLGAAVFAVSVPLLHARAPGSTLIAAALVCAFILFTHRANIRRLIAGTESRFGRRGSDAPAGSGAGDARA